MSSDALNCVRESLIREKVLGSFRSVFNTSDFLSSRISDSSWVGSVL